MRYFGFYWYYGMMLIILGFLRCRNLLIGIEVCSCCSYSLFGGEGGFLFYRDVFLFVKKRILQGKKVYIFYFIVLVLFLKYKISSKIRSLSEEKYIFFFIFVQIFSFINRYKRKLFLVLVCDIGLGFCY